MTGFGEARAHTDNLVVSAELRSVNNRYLKVISRLPDGYGTLESDVESQVRKVCKRGTVQVAIRVIRQKKADDFKLNETALEGYFTQLTELNTKLKGSTPISLESLLTLPGLVADDELSGPCLDDEWPIVQEVLQTALTHEARG